MIICDFCHAPWTEDMIITLADIRNRNNTCIEIVCDSCKKVIYEKESEERD